MHKIPLISLVMLSTLALSACQSAPSVCPKPPAPAAWAMQEPQNLTQQLDKIITVSESK
ncbi:Lipoprotein Rz1 precursor [compost metagenome]